ncbi:hypothetical protein CA11_16170 [Gimesia maris]|nr:hypothetical protein CA11_16170 [Gimesia maris]
MDALSVTQSYTQSIYHKPVFDLNSSFTDQVISFREAESSTRKTNCQGFIF